MFRTGQYNESSVFPSRIGYEAAGVVNEIGEGVSEFAPEGVVVAIPADHPLGANDRVSLSRLAGMPLIVVSGHQNPSYAALLSETLRTT
jgi:NADPH:quinone reductase-like Zn-dependent oxidoreductase